MNITDEGERMRLTSDRQSLSMRGRRAADDRLRFALRRPSVTKHIGIAAVSPEGAALCYRDIARSCTARLGDTGHPAVTLHNEPFELYLDAVLRDDWHTISDLLIKSALALAKCGAEFAITPDNLMQHAVQLAEPRSPIPWLTMTDLVTDAVTGDKRKTVGLIGTKMVMFGSTYQTMLGLRGVKVIAPSPDDAEIIDGIIFRELVHGIVLPESRRKLIDAIDRMGERGAEGVILGCSEAPLILSQEHSPLPMYDATALLAEGAVRFSLGHSARATG